ncbi:MAG: TIM barrel protein, partial [bacterium]|nr:TIM barrel protein [bacterium]
MKLGIGSYAYAWAIGVPGHAPAEPMDVFAFLRRSAERGVRLVQIADNLPLRDLDSGQLEWLEREAETLGVAIEVGTRGIGPESLDTYRELALRFHSPIVRTVIDTPDSEPSLTEVVSRLRWVMPRFERDEITLAIENHDRFTCQEFVQILERVGSRRLRVCLDTVNSFGALEGPEKVVDVLGPWVVNLH